MVVTGMGLTTCLGHEVDTFYNNLLEVGAKPLECMSVKFCWELGHSNMLWGGRHVLRCPGRAQGKCSSAFFLA